MGADAGDLPDVNVWLALAAPSHPHHAAARDYWMQPTLPRIWFNLKTAVRCGELSATRELARAEVGRAHSPDG